MFGALRFFLSYLVVISHLVGTHYVMHFGLYAVRGFFILSGFIITAALQDLYRFDGVRFWKNRLLRLLPPYYVVCVVTLALILLLPSSSFQFQKLWEIDDDISGDLLMNILVLPLQFRQVDLRIFPPYWSVAVELTMYAVLWLAVARSEVIAMRALILGLLFHLICMAVDPDWAPRYFSAPSALLSFSAGSLLYFWKKRSALNVSPATACVALVVWIANMLIADLVMPESYTFGIGYYLATGTFAVVVAGLSGVKYSEVWAAIDNKLGELAYHLFLVQWIGGFLTALLFFPGVWRGWLLTVASTPILIGLSVGLAYLHRRFVEPIRKKVRAGIDDRTDPQASVERAFEPSTVAVAAR